MKEKAKPSALSIAKKLNEQGENEPSIYRYLTIKSKFEPTEAIDHHTQ